MLSNYCQSCANGSVFSSDAFRKLEWKLNPALLDEVLISSSCQRSTFSTHEGVGSGCGRQVRTNRPQSELIQDLFVRALDGGDIFNEGSSPRHRRGHWYQNLARKTRVCDAEVWQVEGSGAAYSASLLEQPATL